MGDLNGTAKVVNAWHVAQQCDGCDGAERWYLRKHRWIMRRARRHGVSADVACTAYAVMSQNQSVAGNDRCFEAWLETGNVYAMGDVQRRVRLAENGDIHGALAYKNGWKIPTFRGNLRFPKSDNGATIDRHAGDVVTGDRRLTKNMIALVRGSGYKLLESAYVEAAAIVGALPHEVQARVWCHRVYCEGAE